MKVEENTKDYLSCEILINKGRTKAWIGQPHLCKKIAQTFGDMVKKLPRYRTPGTPGLVITKPETQGAIISIEDQQMYRSGVGMLLYLVKNSRPDIANAVRELSKGMKEATPGALKELKRVLKFVMDTSEYGLKFEPKQADKGQEWILRLFTDSDWAGDKDSRKSVSGYALFLLDCPIVWKSRQQDIIALSSSEAELLACTEAVKEIKFAFNILESMGMKVKKPVTVRVDNVGAIHLAENAAVSQRTKHIDLRTKFLTNYIEDGFIQIVFVKSGENLSDFLTKNVSSEVYEKHKHAYISKRESIED